MNVDTEHRAALALALVAIVAVALSAATITSVQTFGKGEGFDVTVDGGPTQSDGGDFDPPSGGGNSGPGGIQGSGVKLTTCIEPLTTPLGISGVVFAIVVVLYVIYRRFNAASSIFASFAVVPFFVGAWAFLTNCPGGSGGGGGVTGGGLVSNAGSGVVSSPSVPPWVVGALFGGLMLVSFVVLFKGTGEDEQFEPAVEDEPGEPDTVEFARAASRAADRIEEGNVPVDNAVYRAWLEMTSLLDLPDAETAAPMDFADAAIEVGLQADDVYELTELFNEVRYGDHNPEGREDRALEILRHIEATYQERSGNEAPATGDDATSTGGAN